MKKSIFLTSAIFLLFATSAIAQDQSTPPSSQDPNATQQQDQQQQQQQQPQQQPSATPSASGSQTIQGCLSQSGDNYMLTAEGQTYMVNGDSSQLKDHVGHTVAITGQVTPASSPSSAGAMGAGQNSIMLQSVKMVSEKCETSANPGMASSDSGSNAGAVAAGTAAAGGAAGAAASQAANTASEAAGSASQTASNAPASASDAANNAAQSASQDASGAASQASQSASDTSKAAKGAASQAAGAAENAGQAAGNAATGQSDQSAATSSANQTAQNKLPQTASPLPLVGLLGMGSLAAGLLGRFRK